MDGILKKGAINTKNIFKARFTMFYTFGHKVLEFIAFLALYMLFFSGLELLWNKYITGNGFTFDSRQLPGIAISGIIIWLVFYFTEAHRNKSDVEE